jgi:hypothetical protein
MKYGTFIKVYGDLGRELHFLFKAVPEYNDIYSLCYILIEPSDEETGKFKGVATDNKRMHIVDPLSAGTDTGLEPGAWEVLRAAPDETWIVRDQSRDASEFPDCRKAIPAGEPVYTAVFKGLPRSRENSVQKNLGISFVDFIRGFPEPVAIQFRFLKSLTKYLAWHVEYRGDKIPLVFKSGNMAAVIGQMDYGFFKRESNDL